VVTGKERGIAASMSYVAKAHGVTRGMRLSEIRKLCPDVVILPSDYETYSLLSKRFFAIVRRYTPDVEEYSIDECFADLTGLRRPLRLSYEGMAARIKVDKVWGIGRQTTALLAKHGVHTALDLARRPEEWVTKRFTKPVAAIWQELNGHAVLPVDTQPKETYASIQKVKTFTPPSSDREMVYAQLAKNIENACIKARRYKLAAQRALIFLRTQEFKDLGREVKDKKQFCADLRSVYTAPTEAAGLEALLAVQEKWPQYAVYLKNWETNWAELSTFFAYPDEVRRIIYTTNAIEGLNRQFRKVTKTTAIFPHDAALVKLLWLAQRDITKKWTMTAPNWGKIIAQFAIMFPSVSRSINRF
jgi:DNA polymerase-4/DNA polymerase V